MNWGTTSVFRAARHGHKHILKLLLHCGGNPNMKEYPDLKYVLNTEKVLHLGLGARGGSGRGPTKGKGGAAMWS